MTNETTNGANRVGWTSQQEAVFEWLATPGHNRSLLVRARAGTGKTTTIIEGLRHAPEVKEGGRTLLAAFNKRIATELQSRAPAGVSVKTLHSVGLAAITAAWGRCTIDDGRGKMLAGALIQPHMPVGFAYANSPNPAMRKSPDAQLFTSAVTVVAKLAGVGKRTLCDDPRELARAAWLYEAEAGPALIAAGWPTLHLAGIAAEAMAAAAKRSAMVDFDDMLWVPHAAGLAPTRHDLVVIDEAQDMNAAQLELAIAAAARGGRVVVVGDDRQAIYGFMGAAAGALDRTKERLDADELRLSVTFRCPARVVAAARVYVPDYEAAPSAPAGVVDALPMDKALPLIGGTDFVLSRTNAGAVGACLALLRHGTRATVLGRDVGASIKARVRGFGVDSIASVIVAAREWLTNERAQAEAADRPERADRAGDMCETIIVLAEGLTTVAALLERIDGLFDETAAGRVACSTVHKSKGLEARKVWVMADTFKDRPSLEEENLRYVAMTRALSELHVVGDPGAFKAPLEAAT